MMRMMAMALLLGGCADGGDSDTVMDVGTEADTEPEGGTESEGGTDSDSDADSDSDPDSDSDTVEVGESIDVVARDEDGGVAASAPVLLHAPDGTLIWQGTTDDDGLATVVDPPVGGAVTLVTGGDPRWNLYTVNGVQGGETLYLGEHRDAPTGIATLTLPAVDGAETGVPGRVVAGPYAGQSTTLPETFAVDIPPTAIDDDSRFIAAFAAYDSSMDTAIAVDLLRRVPVSTPPVQTLSYTADWQEPDSTLVLDVATPIDMDVTVWAEVGLERSWVYVGRQTIPASASSGQLIAPALPGLFLSGRLRMEAGDSEFVGSARQPAIGGTQQQSVTTEAMLPPMQATFDATGRLSLDTGWSTAPMCATEDAGVVIAEFSGVTEAETEHRWSIVDGVLGTLSPPDLPESLAAAWPSDDFDSVDVSASTYGFLVWPGMEIVLAPELFILDEMWDEVAGGAEGCRSRFAQTGVR